MNSPNLDLHHHVTCLFDSKNGFIYCFDLFEKDLFRENPSNIQNPGNAPTSRTNIPEHFDGLTT